jgi:hypothetical protein
MVECSGCRMDGLLGDVSLDDAIGGIIGTIVYAATPQVKELALCIVAFEPVEAGGFEVNQWHQGLSDGGIDEMDMAELVLGTSKSLMWRRSDIIIVVNDGRSMCCRF